MSLMKENSVIGTEVGTIVRFFLYDKGRYTRIKWHDGHTTEGEENINALTCACREWDGEVEVKFAYEKSLFKNGVLSIEEVTTFEDRTEVKEIWNRSMYAEPVSSVELVPEPEPEPEPEPAPAPTLKEEMLEYKRKMEAIINEGPPLPLDSEIEPEEELNLVMEEERAALDALRETCEGKLKPFGSWSEDDLSNWHESWFGTERYVRLKFSVDFDSTS